MNNFETGAGSAVTWNAEDPDSIDRPEEKLEEARERFFSELESAGIIESGENGERVVNEALLKQNFPAFLHNHREVLAHSGLTGTGSFHAIEAAVHLFGDRPVVLKSEYESAQREGREPIAKPLVYQPETSQAAFSIEDIANTDFHFAPWQLMQIRDYEHTSLPTIDGEEVNLREASVAVLIYHPNFGRGYRENGKLMVYWPSKNDFRPISSDWFVKEMKAPFGSTGGATKTRGNSLHTPTEFLVHQGQTLMYNDLLELHDFQRLSTRQTSRELAPDQREIPANGTRMIDGIRYYLGKGRIGQRVVQIAPDRAAILAPDPLVPARMKITHTFPLRNRHNPDDVADLKVMTRTNDGRPSTYDTRREQVGLEEYQAGEFEDVDYLLGFSDELARKAGINLMLLESTDQQTIGSAVRSIKKQPERVVAFAKEHGLAGMETLASWEFDPENTEYILKVGELLQADPGAAGEIFITYRDLARGSTEAAREIIEKYSYAQSDSDLDQNTISRVLRGRASSIFAEAVHDLEGVDQPGRQSIAQQLAERFRQERKSLMKTVARFSLMVEDIRHSTSDQQGTMLSRIDQALREVVLGERRVDLPRDFWKDFPASIQETKPEVPGAVEPLYFPVGISKDLPQSMQALDGRLEALKPIDIYGYLFWLQNQGRPVELVVCDEIQTTNYVNLYPDQLGDRPEEAAREKAHQIGREDAAFYQKIIDTFELKNVTLVDYRSFLDRHHESFDRYRATLDGLLENPTWSKALLDMTQESVAGSSVEEKKQFVGYALDEVAWIMASGGTKVSHPNEARYDVVASVLKQCLDEADRRQVTVDSPEFSALLDGVLGAHQDIFNAKKSQARTPVERHYLDRARKHLGLIRRPRSSQTSVTIDRKSVRFDMVVPSTGAGSFGWRTRGAKGEEGQMKFKEPYSTMFIPHSDDFFGEHPELSIEADQVVAAPHGEIAGKIFALDTDTQQRYAEEVVRPLLLHYFKTLEQNPRAYFDEISDRNLANKEALIQECLKLKTLPDAIDFIQRFVVKPSTVGAKAYIY